MNSSLNDPELIEALVENKNILLNGSVSNNENFLTLQERQTIESKIQNEEIETSDFNILDLLQSDERLEMASLMDAVNNSIDFINYLPQISVNSASTIFQNIDMVQNQDEFASFDNNNDSAVDACFEVDAAIASIDQFYELCDLFSISSATKLETTNQNCQVLSEEATTTTVELKASRSSRRIATRKIAMNSKNKYDNLKLLVAKTEPEGGNHEANIKQRLANKNKKRKSSVEESDFYLNTSSENMTESNDNSLDSTIYKTNFNNNKRQRRDSKFNESLGENSNSSYEDDDLFLENLDENSNDREFRNYVRRYEREKNRSGQSNLTKKHYADELAFMIVDDLAFGGDVVGGNFSGNPIKKESNKEAATKYRLKKLSEKDTLFESRMHMEKENDNVKKKIELAQTEISYLKNLLVQMLLTKGVL